MFIPPLRIALSGGGIKGIAHIGALEVLQERGYLRHVREYLGISSGAFCAFCLAIGCTLSELRMVVTMLDFGLMRHVEPETIFQFPETFGLDDGANLDRLIVAILKSKKLSPDLTFGDMGSFAIGLRIYATDLNTCLIQEFSAAATPGVSVRAGLRASMCIPFYFTPVRDLSGHTFVDGGVISHLPFAMLTEKERQTTLCLAFSGDHKPKVEPIKDLAGFVSQLYYSLQFHAIKSLSDSWGSHVAILPCGKFLATNFEASMEEKVELIDLGRKGMEEFLEKVKGTSPPRRFSVA